MAKKLRQEGLSVREIEGRVGVARSTVSLWVRDVELTVEQREDLCTRPRPSNAAAFRRRRQLSQDHGRVEYGGFDRPEWLETRRQQGAVLSNR